MWPTFKDLYLFFRERTPRRYLIRFGVCCALVVCLQAFGVMALFAHLTSTDTSQNVWLDISLAASFSALIFFLLMLILEFWPLCQAWLLDRVRLNARIQGHATQIARFKSLSLIHI